MESCPIEILQQIFELACTDGGKTARSLSLVSRGVHSQSKRSRFLTVALLDAKQLTAFSGLLSSSACPSQALNVRHLFIAASAQDDSQSTIHSTSSKRAKIFSTEIRSAVSNTLSLLAPSLLTLSMYFNFPSPDWVILPLPFSFPSLSKLALNHSHATGFLPQTTLSQLPSCPKLRRLALMGFIRADPSVNIIETVQKVAPALTHICIPVSSVNHATLLSNFPPSASLPLDVARYANGLSYLLVYPSPQPSIIDTVPRQVLGGRKLDSVARKWGHAQSSWASRTGKVNVREAWLQAWAEGMDGGCGYWSLAAQ
ncbi:hypothetical protein FIBSPDRAFT_311351 [Athelia psychrophila]|uniref:F-box domain-containing protein n=1 Tax=Athelia psychrophila TaxID=1759441 RepID=A0A166WBM3_9AGAM|nr:hypothetical protein FIBSPDRAFT_311351 [Fibularhizoctonia sp. CBS 109695]